MSVMSFACLCIFVCDDVRASLFLCAVLEHLRLCVFVWMCICARHGVVLFFFCNCVVVLLCLCVCIYVYE